MYMKMLRTIVTGALSMAAVLLMAADDMVNGQQVTIPVRQVKADGPRVVRLQVVNDNIIRVQATSESQLPEKQSLIVVNQTAKPKFTAAWSASRPRTWKPVLSGRRVV